MESEWQIRQASFSWWCCRRTGGVWRSCGVGGVMWRVLQGSGSQGGRGEQQATDDGESWAIARPSSESDCVLHKPLCVSACKCVAVCESQGAACLY